MNDTSCSSFICSSTLNYFKGHFAFSYDFFYSSLVYLFFVGHYLHSVVILFGMHIYLYLQQFVS